MATTITYEGEDITEQVQKLAVDDPNAGKPGHIPSPDCWCKPKVTEAGSTRTIHHIDRKPKGGKAK